MFLVVPTAGQQPGPDFALNVNADLTLIDQHDHTPGKGAQITPAGLNINAAVDFNDNFLTTVAGVTFNAQGSTPAIGTIYESGVDLYFVDGLGNNIQITQNGGIAGTPGSISNLTPPASASYISASKKFVWQSDTSIAADMDFAAAIMRNISPDSAFALTLQPPAALASNYTVTLPLLPSTKSFMTIDTSGNLAGDWNVDGVTTKIIGNQIVAQAAAVSPMREHSWELNGGYPTLTYPLTNIDSIFFAPANITISSVWIYNGVAGGAGTTEFDLLVASPGGGFTSILTTTGKITSAAAANIWTDSGSVVGAQTGVTKPVILTANISAGQAIRFDLLQSMTTTATDARIRIFYSLA